MQIEPRTLDGPRNLGELGQKDAAEKCAPETKLGRRIRRPTSADLCRRAATEKVPDLICKPVAQLR